ncbi:MAG TPA: RNA polymerase sigma factor [Bacteroidales bacterium]|nr:RNA polymerase sigma factor [Bacteroidales bacterium]
MNNLNINIHSDLIEGCREGNTSSQFALYKQYSKAMYNLAFRILNNREDAEDILQETFIDCFNMIGTFRFESTFGAWLKRILVNKCLNHLKRRKPLISFYDELPDCEEEQDDEKNFYDLNKIYDGIKKLPDGYRIIFTLYLLEGYDHEEIGQILGISESTSKSQYSRARQKLKKIITE